MSYTKQTWADKPATTSPLSAARLQHMEDGIETTSPTAFEALVDGATITWATGGKLLNNAAVTLGGDRVLDITGAVDGASGYLEVTQDATGGRTLTLPAGTVLGSVTSIGTTANKKTAVAWSYNGTAFTFVLAKES